MACRETLAWVAELISKSRVPTHHRPLISVNVDPAWQLVFQQLYRQQTGFTVLTKFSHEFSNTSTTSD
jgi:hypothetical protein